MLTLAGYVRRNLGRRRLRTFLAALGVMLGVWLVVAFSAFSDGFVRTAQAMLRQFGEDFHVYRAGVADQFLSTLPHRETRARVEAVPGVRDTAGVLVWIARTPKVPFVLIFGLEPGEFALEALIARGEGGFGPDPESDEAIVGRKLLLREGLSVGGDLTLEGGSFRIVGTFETGQAFFDHAIVMRLAKVQRRWVGGADLVSWLVARTDDPDRPAPAARLVEERHPDLATVVTLDELSKVDRSLKNIRTMSTVITVVATAIGFLFVLLAMIMAVYERVREVGVLRAVGWSKGAIVLALFIEALLISVAGVLAGIPTGLLLVEVIARITDLSNFLEPTWEWGLLARSLVVALVAAAIGAVYPAWRAARLHPAEAIRHE
ncbi:MAG: ABC transporter permease [Planctomycetes bacterium]|jgi:putative ABC transport system permease protein|nr:ABC transporter permease [Planctomycetota bacterium]